MKPKTFDRKKLLTAADEILTFLALQDPMFEERIQITKDEYQLDSLQVALTYMARTLDLGEHMYYCEREFMHPGYSGHLGERTCAICQASFSGGRGTDTVCANPDCLAAQAKALDAAFEERQNAKISS